MFMYVHGVELGTYLLIFDARFLVFFLFFSFGFVIYIEYNFCFYYVKQSEICLCFVSFFFLCELLQAKKSHSYLKKRESIQKLT